MKKKATLLIWVSILLIAGSLLSFLWMKKMEMNVYRLREPMLISSTNGTSNYMIPPNTIFHYQKGYAEGHQLYTMEVYFKGTLPAEKVSPSAETESTWLYQIDADDVSKVLQQYPLSKEDLVRILKARKMTRDDLAQIVREWKDD